MLHPTVPACRRQPVRQVTLSIVAVRSCIQSGSFSAAAVKGEGASWVKRTSCRNGQRRRQLPDQCHILAAPAHPHLRCGTQQGLRVGMQRRCKHRICIADLDHASEVHHRDPVREMAHDAQVMRDEQDREPKVALQVQTAGLVSVPAPKRLVTIRFRRRSACPVGPTGRGRSRCAGAGRRRTRAETVPWRRAAAAPATAVRRCARIRPGTGHDLVHLQRLLQHLAHGHAWVERAVGVLKHQLHTAVVLPQRIAAQRPYIFAGKTDLSGIELDQSHQCPGQRALAAAGLADHGQCLSTRHGQGYTVERADNRAPAVPARPRTGKLRTRSSQRSSTSAVMTRSLARAAPRHGDGCRRSRDLRQVSAIQAARAGNPDLPALQRGAKRQPGGRLSGSGGAPGIAARC